MITESEKINILEANIFELSYENSLHVLNIEFLTPELEMLINKYLILICYGSAESDIETVKIELKEYLAKKKDSNLEMGSIAEFIAHLYLVTYGYKQEFLYLNLEEGSIKKGFDGYYTKDDEEWIFESKSGYFSSQNVSHKSKINDGCVDIKNKILGKVDNNPWKNAYNHARHGDVGSSNNILNNLKKLSDNFIHSVFSSEEDYNIIPGSTIFFENMWSEKDDSELCDEIDLVLNKYKFKKINALCINKKTINIFRDYINK